MQLSESTTICFDTSTAMRDFLEINSQKSDISMSKLINKVLHDYFDIDQNINRRTHDRVDVDLLAVARPVEENIGTQMISGKVSDLSAGGLKLHCEARNPELLEKIKVGSTVEVIFTLNNEEYPVCFTCEVKHIFNQDSSQIGCQFQKYTGDSLYLVEELVKRHSG